MQFFALLLLLAAAITTCAAQMSSEEVPPPLDPDAPILEDAPISGQWCTECKLRCAEGRCAVLPEYARIKKQEEVNWLEVSRLCPKPILPSAGTFTVNSIETAICDEQTNITHFPRSNCINPNKPIQLHGLQPNCFVTEEVIVEKYASLSIKGIKSPYGLRPIISGNRESRILFGEAQSKIYLEGLDFVNGFVEGLPLYVNKDNPVDGFYKIHGKSGCVCDSEICYFFFLVIKLVLDFVLTKMKWCPLPLLR